MILQYKCPNCGADMVFDAEKGTLFCESCETAMAVEEYPVGDFEEFEEMTSASTFADDSATQYQCKNCGAILITDADTAATSCSFCGSPMILSDRLSGQMASRSSNSPRYFVPATRLAIFKLTRRLFFNWGGTLPAAIR